MNQAHASYELLVKAVRLDGEIVGAPAEGMHDRITYDYVTINTLDVLPPALLENVAPVNRPTRDADIVSANTEDYAEMRLNRTTGVARVYQFGESIPFDPCPPGAPRPGGPLSSLLRGLRL